MTVVSNAGPLIALGGIHRLGLLRTLFSRVLVPELVAREVFGSGSHRLGAAELQQADWVEVVPVPAIEPLLTTTLGPGEAAVVMLARQHVPALALIDESKARRVARDVYGLAVIGTGRVLVEAKRAGVLSSVTDVLNSIRANGYWLSDRIVAEILAQAGEG